MLMPLQGTVCWRWRFKGGGGFEGGGQNNQRPQSRHRRQARLLQGLEVDQS